MRVLLLVLALLAPLPPAAAEPLGAAEFDRLVTGQTLHYRIDGRPYGIERYMEGRRVLWSLGGGPCQTGRWFPAGDLICFLYDHAPGDPQCWTFRDEGGELAARYENDPDAGRVYRARPGPPMSCAPAVGV